ncbi:hypothetical protein LCGC14_0729040 [marine sediment metagenome]|uniref:Uncharacterized protein n=1 Tax=marine sediment metagenome TaxID=412755 RepID=A0A0F9QV84_9ZZZZ
MICKCCHKFANTGKFWYDDTDFYMYIYGEYPEDIQFICLYCNDACTANECFRPKSLDREGNCEHLIGNILKFDLKEKRCINCGKLEEDLNTRKSKDNYDLGFE